ncbi:MAG: FecR domain-containing protein [Odoribacter sp.]
MKKKINWSVIRNILDQTATPEETKIYQKWLDVSPRHREYMQQIKNFKGETPHLTDEKVHQYNQELILMLRKRQQRRHIIRWSSVAASLTLILGAGVLLMQTQQENTLQTETISTLASNQKETVTLTLPSGKIYDLESSTSEIQETVMQEKKALDQSPAYRIINVPHGKTWQFTLPDSSRVYVNANSRIKFPESFEGQDNRQIELESGEAYFQVRKDTDKPFIVTVGQVATKVYGTEFNINAYHPEHPRTTLVRGSVSMKYGSSLEEMFLKPGQEARADESGRFIIGAADLESVTAWREGIFLFKNTTLLEITEQLEDWYKVKFYFKREELKQERFYCRLLRTSSLEIILEALGKNGITHFSYQDNMMIVY